jgi:hypothetical protein
VRELFFEGFRRLREELEALAAGGPPRADLERLLGVLREFVRANPVLAEVMFSRPFADFDPGPAELKAGAAVRKLIVGSVRRCLEVRVLGGDESDIAHVLLALVQGLAAQERAGWLGSSQASIDRRWRLAVRSLLDGLAGTSADG